MASSYELKVEKSKYKYCLTNAQNMASQLNSAIKKLETVISIQKSCYVIDGVSGAGSYINNLLEKEKGIYNNLVNNIIPGVRTKISNLDWRIQQEEAKERQGK